MKITPENLAKLAELLCDETTVTADERPHVIIRGDRSGVFYGRLVSREGTEVRLAEARHIWYWDGAANTAEIAMSGVSKPKNCKIVGPHPLIEILDAIEVLTCTPEAVASLDAVPHWSER